MGNSHQRAIERAQKARIEKQISVAINKVLADLWYQSGLFWGCLSLATAIVLAVIAATPKDLRWLLFLALPLFVIPFWLMCRGVSRVPFRWICKATR